MSTATAGSAAAAMASMWLARAPARYDSATARIMRARLLPRSGWTMVSPAMSPATMSGGRSPWVKLAICSRRRARNAARYTTRANFASSTGWNDSGPPRNHRRVPLISWPKGGTRTSTRRTNEAASSGTTRRSSRR